jgi:hypothetical protein
VRLLNAQMNTAMYTRKNKSVKIQATIAYSVEWPPFKTFSNPNIAEIYVSVLATANEIDVERDRFPGFFSCVRKTPRRALSTITAKYNNVITVTSACAASTVIIAKFMTLIVSAARSSPSQRLSLTKFRNWPPKESLDA